MLPEEIGKPIKYSFDKLLTVFPKKLPHYKEIEVETLKKFVDLNFLPGDYSFDVRIPYELTEEEKKLAEEEKRMIINLKSMRIDAVVETADEVWILEVAKNIKLSYTGKLEGYAFLYKKIYKPTKPVKKGVVALVDSKMAREALEHMDTKIWIVKLGF